MLVISCKTVVVRINGHILQDLLGKVLARLDGYNHTRSGGVFPDNILQDLFGDPILPDLVRHSL